MKKILFGLVIIAGLSSNIKAENNMDPISQEIIIGTATVAGALIGWAGVESYNELNNNNNNNNDTIQDNEYFLNADDTPWD